MNSPNSTPGERDLEALRRAQRAHEPSMEEILASIRSIIADDREPRRGRGQAGARRAARRSSIPRTSAPSRACREPPPPAEPHAPKVVWSAPHGRGRAPRARRVRAARMQPDSEGGAAAVRPGRRGRHRRLRGPLRQSGAAKRGIRRERDARDPEADAEGLARRKSAEPGRAPGARRNPARRARRPLSGGVYEAAPGFAAGAALRTLTFAAALALSGRGRRAFRARQRFSRWPRAAPRSSTRRARRRAALGRAVPGAAR